LKIYISSASSTLAIAFQVFKTLIIEKITVLFEIVCPL